MTIYERYCEIRDKNGLKDAHIAEATGIGRSTFSDWKSGRSIPKREKLTKIADALGVTVDYLIEGESEDGYYYNKETLAAAQEIYKNPDMKLLFDTADGASSQELRQFAEMIAILRRKERHED